MIIFGTESTRPGIFDPMYIPGIKKVLVLNLYSLFDMGEQIPNIIPFPFPVPELVYSDDQVQLDMIYADYLTNHIPAFMDLMKILYPLYENSDLLVYILISHDPYRDVMTESLIKFIQERYGYICNLINTLEDVLYVQDGSFSYNGIIAMDMDKEKYINILYDTGQLNLPNDIEEVPL